MALLLSHSISAMTLGRRLTLMPSSLSSTRRRRRSISPCFSTRRSNGCALAFFNPFEDQPIIKDAIREPVAFMGGMFAGLLRLDLNEEPLRDWITRTAEAAGVDVSAELDAEGPVTDGRPDEPQQIEIE